MNPTQSAQQFQKSPWEQHSVYEEDGVVVELMHIPGQGRPRFRFSIGARNKEGNIVRGIGIFNKAGDARPELAMDYMNIVARLTAKALKVAHDEMCASWEEWVTRKEMQELRRSDRTGGETHVRHTGKTERARQHKRDAAAAKAAADAIAAKRQK